MQRLGVTLRRSHRLNCGAADVVVDVLGGQGPAGGLRVRTQRHRLRVLRAEFLHELRPEHARGTHLGDLHEEVHADRPEEGQTRRELVDVEAHRLACADVLDTVGQRVGHLDVGRRASFLHVVAGDGDRVELWHVRAGEREDVGDDLHRRRGRVDVGVADHELLQNVILNRSGELLGLDALLLGRDDVERQDGQHRAVHGHGHRHLVERDAIEQLTHVEDRVDGHTGHADVAGHAWVVGVVAAVGREVECDREALLAGREVATVEGVGFLSRREARVLTDRPGLVDVHRGVGAAKERRDARSGLEEVETLQVLVAEERRNEDVFRGLPPMCVSGLAEDLIVLVVILASSGLAEIDVVEAGDAHLIAPIRSSVLVRSSTTSMPS